jgi:hypothetical protein
MRGHGGRHGGGTRYPPPWIFGMELKIEDNKKIYRILIIFIRNIFLKIMYYYILNTLGRSVKNIGKLAAPPPPQLE